MSDDTNPGGPAGQRPEAPKSAFDTPREDRLVAGSGERDNDRDTVPGEVPDTIPPASPEPPSPAAAQAPGARSPDAPPRPEFLGPYVPGAAPRPMPGAAQPSVPPSVPPTMPPPGTQPGYAGGAVMPPAGAPPHGGGGAYGEPPYATGPIPPQRRPNRWARWTVAGAGALVLFVGAGAGGAAIALHYGGGSTLPAVQPAQGTSSKTANGSVASVAKAVSPSVVAISVQVANGEVQGSGVIMKSDGTILTNNHVVADAANGGTIQVQFSDGQKATASIVGRDPSSDLAVIKAKGVSGLKAASFANSDSVQVGDSVIAIGSPLGLNGTVTSGIVSAVNRSITLDDSQSQDQGQLPFGQGQNSTQQQSTSTVVSAIQTDAAINHGNSGGPLLNSAGQVIGINTAIASSGGGATSSSDSGNIGVGFAIPSSQAHDVAQQLVSTGKAEHAYLGVSVADSPSTSGAVVAGVESNSPAAKAGLKKGDVITKVDGNDVSDSGSLVAYIRGKKDGDQVTVTYTRNGSSHTATVTLSQKAG